MRPSKEVRYLEEDDGANGYSAMHTLVDKGWQCSRRKQQLQRGCAVAPRSYLEHMPVPHIHGCRHGKTTGRVE